MTTNDPKGPDSLAPLRMGLARSALIAALAASGLIYFESTKPKKNTPPADVKQVEQLEAEIKSLQSEIAALRSELAESGKLVEPAAAAALKILTPPEEASESEARSERPRRGRAWFAEREIEGLERFVSLSDSEKSELKERLPELPPTRAARRELFKEVLGEERAGWFEKAAEDERGRRDAEEREQEVIVLSRKLSLSAEQEESVRQAYARSAEQLAPKREILRSEMEKAMSLHSGEGRGEELRTTFENIRNSAQALRTAEESMIRDQLKDSLTVEQLSELSAFQLQNRQPFLDR
jgi:hypothetical protein